MRNIRCTILMIPGLKHHNADKNGSKEMAWIEANDDPVSQLSHFRDKLTQGMMRDFIEKVKEYNARIDAMPKTYEQDGLGEQAVAHLHYFTAGGDWYVTERDVDIDQTGQIQAFGLADPFQDGGELGYISIVELRRAGAELDLHWTPKTLAEIRTRRQSA